MTEKTEGPWTEFMDMHSGGGQKLEWAYIYIEAPEREAQLIFQRRFGRNPNRVTCTCCGSDYSITEYPTLQRATAFNRGCRTAYYDKDGKEVALELGEYFAPYGSYATSEYVEEPNRRFNATATLETVEEYASSPSVKIIRANEIQSHESSGSLEEEGYVWR